VLQKARAISQHLCKGDMRARTKYTAAEKSFLGADRKREKIIHP